MNSEKGSRLDGSMRLDTRANVFCPAVNKVEFTKKSVATLKPLAEYSVLKVDCADGGFLWNSNRTAHLPIENSPIETFLAIVNESG